jgi:O-antigen/teichoic acid export membrane protein
MSDQRQIASALSWNLFGKTTFFLLKFLESLLLVRLLGSEQYGLYGSLINLQAIGALVISLGLESVIGRFVPQFRTEQDYAKIRTLMRKVVRLRSLLILLAVAAVLLGADRLSSLLFHGSLSADYLKLAVVLLALVSLHTIFRAFLDLFFHLKFINIMDVAAQSTYLAIAYVLVRLGYGLTGVLGTLIAVNSVALLALYVKYRRERALLPGSTGRSEVGKKRLYAYSGTLYLLSLLNYVLGKGLDVLLIGILLSDLRQVTFYLLAFNVAFYAVSVTDLAVSGNFVVALIVEARTQGNAGMLRKIYGGLFEFVYLFIIPIAVGGVLLRTEIIRVLYTSENLAAAGFLSIFLVALSVAKLSSIASTFLVLLDKEKTIAVSRTFLGAANLVLDLILIPRYGAFGAVVATSSILLLIALYETFLLHRLIKPAYSMTFLAKVAAASAVMAVGIILLDTVWVERLAVKVPVVIVAGGMLYMAGIALLKPVSAANAGVLSKSNLPFRDQLLKLFSRQNPSPV